MVMILLGAEGEKCSVMRLSFHLSGDKNKEGRDRWQHSIETLANLLYN
jgi:hypothetical protein